MPAVRVTVMVTVPPEATVTGKLVQAPWLKSVVMLTVWGPVPSLTVIGLVGRCCPSRWRRDAGCRYTQMGTMRWTRDLVGVVVGRGAPLGLVRVLQRAHVAGGTDPAVPRTLIQTHGRAPRTSGHSSAVPTRQRHTPVSRTCPPRFPCGADVYERRRGRRWSTKGGPASPRKMPERTALMPAVRVTVMVTVPPGGDGDGEAHPGALAEVSGDVDGVGSGCRRSTVIARVGRCCPSRWRRDARFPLYADGNDRCTDLVGVVVGRGAAIGLVRALQARGRRSWCRPSSTANPDPDPPSPHPTTSGHSPPFQPARAYPCEPYVSTQLPCGADV